MKETTTFEAGDATVTVTGSTISLTSKQSHDEIILDRAQARDLSKALSHAADIVRTKRKRPQVGNNA